MTEDGWLEGDDPRKMLRFLKRYPELRPAARKEILLACACARSVWDQMSSRARQLTGYWEEAADDLSWMDRVNSIYTEVGGEVETPASAIAHACNATAAIDAALAVPGVIPASLCVLVHEVFGNPFREVVIDPAWLGWNGGVVRATARGIYEERAFEQLPVLADALEDAGCTDQALLAHLRSRGPIVVAAGRWTSCSARPGATRGRPPGRYR
jgi:hypothetical protein